MSTPSIARIIAITSAHEDHRARRRPHRPRARRRAPRGARDHGRSTSTADRLAALSARYDVRTVEGDGTTERVIRKAGVEEADLFIGCSPREEANLVGAMLAKRLSGAQTIVRNDEHGLPRRLARAPPRGRLHGLARARDRERDRGHARAPRRPPDRHVRRRQGPDRRVRRARRRAAQQPDRAQPAQRGDAGRLQGRGDHPRRRDDRPARRRAGAARRPRRRHRLTGRPRAPGRACAAARRSASTTSSIFGAGQMGTTIARVLLERGIRVRIVDADRDRVRAIAERLPRRARVPRPRVRPGVPRPRADRPRERGRVLPSTTTRATSTARSSPSATACA